jgi:hypothetical protein
MGCVETEEERLCVLVETAAGVTDRVGVDVLRASGNVDSDGVTGVSIDG